MADKQHGVQIPECSDTNTESFNKATASTKLTTSASSGHTEQDCSDAPTPQLPWLICRLQQIQSLRSKKPIHSPTCNTDDQSPTGTMPKSAVPSERIETEHRKNKPCCSELNASNFDNSEVVMNQDQVSYQKKAKFLADGVLSSIRAKYGF